MIVIGIAGGTGSGKTTVVNKIINSFPPGEVAVIPQDSYYKDSSHVPVEERSKINFDEPDAIEWSLLVDHLGSQRRQEGACPHGAENFILNRRLWLNAL